MPMFHPRFVGLTGDAVAIEAAARAYRVYYEKVEREDKADYTVDHSAFIYLIGRDGKYLGFFAWDLRGAACRRPETKSRYEPLAVCHRTFIQTQPTSQNGTSGPTLTLGARD
jgi:hypothetical protein